MYILTPGISGIWFGFSYLKFFIAIIITKRVRLDNFFCKESSFMIVVQVFLTSDFPVYLRVFMGKSPLHKKKLLETPRSSTHISNVIKSGKKFGL